MQSNSHVPEDFPVPTCWNEDFGFYGTMEDALHNAREAWPLAVWIVAEVSDESMIKVVGAFLDSRWGRKYACEVIEQINGGMTLEEALRHVAEIWMNQPPSPRTRAENYIYKEYSYLVGVMYAAAMIWQEL